MPTSSAEAKQLMFRKDRVFTTLQNEWLQKFLETARRSGRERLYMQRTREILTHLRAPRSLMQQLGVSIPVAGGNSPRVTVLDATELLSRVRQHMADAPTAFPADDRLVVMLRHLVVYCGATRENLATPVVKATDPSDDGLPPE